jgi:tetratricopeptide (TPR) repeat protein
MEGWTAGGELMSTKSLLGIVFLLLACLPPSSFSATAYFQVQNSRSEQVQITPPMRRVEPPSPAATAEALEARGDTLRAEKKYFDAMDYYRAALTKKPNDPRIYNKAGIAELLMQRWREASRDFQHAIKGDVRFPDAYNNLGVISYEQKKYGKAIKQYKKAIQLQPSSASFHSNLGAAYFSKKEFENASIAYADAIHLDPEIFERTSRNGVTAQLSSPGDRAHYDYVVAKLYAKMGSPDRSLEYLKRALEEGYKDVNNVYKDPEFADLRKDARFTQLMSARPLSIPE